jgi:hypothetical protein
LPSVFPPGGGVSARRLVGCAALPLVGFLAFIARVSLRADGGDDCLGWTVLAAVSS